jgi:hypothetical protein
MSKFNHFEAFKKATKKSKKDIESKLKEVTDGIIKIFHSHGMKEIREKHIPLINKFLSRHEYLDEEKIKDAVDYLMNVVKEPELIKPFLDNFIDIKIETYLLIQDWYELRKRSHILKKLDGDVQDKKKYDKIVEAFYYKMRDEILKGRVWDLGFGVGEIEVTKIERLVRFNAEGDQIFQPDWKKSMENKKRLIAEGKTPRSKDNPDGVDWLIPNKEKYMVGFNWKKKARLLQNAYHFEFIPLRGQHNPATQLYDYRRENPTADLNYRIIERKKKSK